VVLWPGDQVALPVAGDGAVVGFGWSLADVDHVRDPSPPLGGAAAGFAQRSAGSQASDQFTA